VKYDMSVVVLCYEPDTQSLKNTLNSIIRQENCKYEIIIADDGSKKEYFSEIRQWLNDQNIKNVVFVKNEKNGGTVKNFISGLLVAQGKYVKDISPGDYLYSKDVLYSIVKYMDEYKSKVCFGNAVYYYEENGKLQLKGKQNPVDLKPYKTNNKKIIKKNYIYFQDYILGACFAFERECILKYATLISPYVLYAEDISVICMVYDGISVDYLEKDIIWYECGSGISTSGNSKWNNILRNENRLVYENYLNNEKEAYQFVHQMGVPSKKTIIKKVMKKPSFLLFLVKLYFNERKTRKATKDDVANYEAIIKSNS